MHPRPTMRAVIQCTKFDMDKCKNQTIYYLFFIKNHVLVRVSKRQFRLAEGKFLKTEKGKVKVVGEVGSRQETTKALRAKFAAESLLSTFMSDVRSTFDGVKTSFNDFKDGISFLLSTLVEVGKGAQLVMCMRFKIILAEIVDILIKIQNVSLSSISSIVSTLIGFYKLVLEIEAGMEINRIQRGDQVFVPADTAEFRPEGIEALGLSMLSFMLPDALVKILQRMTLFTSERILDAYNGLGELTGLAIDFVKTALEKVTPSIPILQYLVDALEYIPFGSHFAIITRMEHVLEEYNKDPKSMISETFRLQVKLVYEQAKNSKKFMDWYIRSNAAKAVYADYTLLFKRIGAYEAASRVEPSCFIFEGPPGCFKSVTMDQLIQSMETSSYSHATKAMMDGKDWYDSYNGESIFYMDDLGAQGVSQWRNLINMVSPVKLPLDCASANLKDTKFFCSDLVFITTNSFESITGLCKTDCISDITALWRRAYVFDFSGAKRVNNKLLGKIAFKYFDVTSQQWEYKFPDDVKARLPKDFSSDVEIGQYTPRVEYLKWLKQIIQAARRSKMEQYQENALSERELSQLREPVFFDAESDRLHPTWNHHANPSGPWRVGNYNDATMRLPLTDKLWQAAHTAAGIARWASLEAASVIGHYIKEAGSMIMGAFARSDFTGLTVTGIVGCGVGMLLGLLFHGMCTTHIVDVSEHQVYGPPPSCTKNCRVTGLRLDPSDPRVQRSGLQLSAEGGDVLPQAVDAKDTATAFLSNSVFECDIVGSNYTASVSCAVSGHMIILPLHAVMEEEVHIVIYKNRAANQRLVEVPVHRVYAKEKEDVAILQLPPRFPTPFKNLAKHFKIGSNSGNAIAKHIYLITPERTVSVSDNLAPAVDGVSPYTMHLGPHKYQGYVSSERDTFYTFHKPGMCGSLLFDTQEGVIGMHVAGEKRMNVGAALVWSKQTNAEMRDLLFADNEFVLDVGIANTKKENFSGIKLDRKEFISVPKDTKYMPTPLYGVFEVTREPAQLSKNGPMTIKDVASKSFASQTAVPLPELEFGKKAIRSLLTTFDEIDEKTIVKGNDNLAGLNKDSSNGYKLAKDKASYINFEEGKFTTAFRLELQELENRINAGQVAVDDLVWTETLKDELRNTEKAGVPRSFRVSRLHIQVLTKKYFGAMVEQIVTHKFSNEIMVGVNPYKDWDRIYRRLRSAKGVWAGDVGKWDGHMVCAVQLAIKDAILEKVQPHNRKISDFILTSLPFCVVAIADNLYLTNHSMPSGSFLTAILNSLVNRFYTAMWYYREYNKNVGVPPTVPQFMDTVIDYVYGDDKLNGVMKDENFLNAITMRDFFKSIGLDLTTAKKQEITAPFEPLDSVSFLKREFVYNKDIGRIVGCLDPRTIMSGISWYNTSKENANILQDKLHVLQRELFLWGSIPVMRSAQGELMSRSAAILQLRTRCEREGVDFKELSHDYLLQLFENNSHELFQGAAYQKY